MGAKVHILLLSSPALEKGADWYGHLQRTDLVAGSPNPAPPKPATPVILLRKPPPSSESGTPSSGECKPSSKDSGNTPVGPKAGLSPPDSANRETPEPDDLVLTALKSA